MLWAPDFAVMRLAVPKTGTLVGEKTLLISRVRKKA